MKRIVLLLMVFIPYIGFSQFILTKDGMVDEKDQF